MISSVNFKARFIHNTTINEYRAGKYEPIKANFVEIDPLNFNDRKAISILVGTWGDDLVNLRAIRSNIEGLATIKKDIKLYIYALTLQQDNFQKVDFNKILGLVQIDKSNQPMSIDYLQVNPVYKKQTNEMLKQRKYKYIGKAIMNSVIQNFPKEEIWISSTDSAKNFYKKFGFKEILNRPNTMIRR